MPHFGQIIMTIPPVFLAFGAFYFDFNATHVHNPLWPGHARFHNGQTMSMAVALGLLGLHYAWRSARRTTLLPYVSEKFLASGGGSSSGGSKDKDGSKNGLSEQESTRRLEGVVLAEGVARMESVWVAALLGSVYCLTGLSAQFYPGALCVDREFWVDGVHPGCPQNFIFGVPLVLNWVGYFVAVAQIKREMFSVLANGNIKREMFHARAFDEKEHDH